MGIRKSKVRKYLAMLDPEDRERMSAPSPYEQLELNFNSEHDNFKTSRGESDGK